MLNVSSRRGSDLVNIYLHKTIDQYAQSTAAVVNKNPVVLICEDADVEKCQLLNCIVRACVFTTHASNGKNQLRTKNVIKFETSSNEIAVDISSNGAKVFLKLIS
jgi:hypothetical protein